jgi:UDP-3-O-[3-hydroxymyristoyl] N-acetylglucosamine deacetylase / 3-hydroxyacyl-[acyl-carrier-protein] dehydratase
MKNPQQTIQKTVQIKGTGLHTGKKVVLQLLPADEDTGIVFRRTDLNPAVEIPAMAPYVHDTSRGTSLKHKDAIVYTVEHLMAALTGLQIDNCIVELNNEEIPIMDGSSIAFVEAIEEAGIVEQNKEREYFEVKEVIRYVDKESGAEILCLPADEFKVTVLVDYDTKVLGTQNAVLNTLKDFKKEIASARTFSFLHELEYLLDKGLIKGGDIRNAIVYVDKQIAPDTLINLKKVFEQPDVDVTPNGILNNINLKYPNEAARHKLLDVIGDVALAGRAIKGHIIATKPGHKANTGFAKELQQIIKLSKKSDVPVYDPSAEPLMDVVRIMEMLPHRPPFLLVDKVLELSDTHVVGLKNVTMNETFFNGHFPGAPVMPGVLQVEAMAQVGGILALSTVPDPENYLTYFLRLDSVKFKSKVVPGDTLIFKLLLSAPIRRGLIQMTGEAYVGDKLVMQADMLAQIKKEKNL